MHHRYLQIVTAMAGITALACGGLDADNQNLSVNVAYSESALADNIGMIRLVAHNNVQATCARVRGFPENAGYFKEDIVVTDNLKSNGGSKTISSLEENSYTVAIFGFADETATDVVAFGCEEGIMVTLGVLTPVEIMLEPVTD
jgi:hypothetical protein